MSTDITVHISIGSAGATASASGQATIASHAGAEGAPPPLALDQLQAGSAQSAPGPQAPEELAASNLGIKAEAGAPPPPMAIERLMQTSTSAAPTPMDVAALSADLGPPAPQSMEALGNAAASLPAPVPPDQLGSQGSGGEPAAPDAEAGYPASSKKKDK